MNQECPINNFLMQSFVYIQAYNNRKYIHIKLVTETI